MANRHLCRSLAMQTLFELDFREIETIGAIDPTANRITAEFAPGAEDFSYVKELAHGVADHRQKIDAIITQAAPDWPIDQIAIVDRNILRLGLYELIFADRADVPSKVAINEAIELAKTFGGESSGRFVNGVLGTVYKELGEPGKNDAPVKKKKIIDIPYDQMPIEKLAGALVWCRFEQQFFLALVHDVFGYWTLSKGHLESAESLTDSVRREVSEELGLAAVTVGEELGVNEYVASDPEKGKTRRQVTYFSVEVAGKPALILEKKGGLDDARWFRLEEVPELRLYDDILPIITKAIRLLVKTAKTV